MGLNFDQVDENDKAEKWIQTFFDKTAIIFDFENIFSIITGKISISTNARMDKKYREILARFLLPTLKECKKYMISSSILEKNKKLISEKVLAHLNNYLTPRCADIISSLKVIL